MHVEQVTMQGLMFQILSSLWTCTPCHSSLARQRNQNQRFRLRTGDKSKSLKHDNMVLRTGFTSREDEIWNKLDCQSFILQSV